MSTALRQGIARLGRSFESDLARLEWKQNLVPWLRDGLLLIALGTALSSLDSQAPLAVLWRTLPLALASMALALARRDAPKWNWTGTRTLFLIAAALGMRIWGSLAGPLPGEGVREAMDLGVILALSAAVWQMAMTDGRRALAIWTLASLAGWLIEWGTYWMSRRDAAGQPDASFETIGSPAGRLLLGLSLLAGIGLLEIARQRSKTAIAKPPAPRAGAIESAARRMRRMIVFVAGVAVGWLISRLPSGLPFELELPFVAGRRAVQALWLESLLFGWGRHAVEPLGRVLAQPHAAAFEAWGGIWAMLAMGGLFGVGVLIGVCLSIAGRPPAQARPRGVPVGAASVALLFGGILLGGGPGSGVCLLVFSGWIALALAATSKQAADGERIRIYRWTPEAIAATGLTAIGLFVLAYALSWPVAGNRMLVRSTATGLTSAQRETLIARAEALNPGNPAIPLQMADALRQRMSATPGWSESLYGSVIGAYEAAQRIDPYETLFTLREAQFQILCSRQDAAIQTVEAGLARQPNASELCEWLYHTARRFQLRDEIYRSLDRGLKMAPMQPFWWNAQYEMAQAAGQRTLASRSLGVVLTANPEDGKIASEAWLADQGRQVELPSVRLPGSDDMKPRTDDIPTSPTSGEAAFPGL